MEAGTQEQQGTAPGAEGVVSPEQLEKMVSERRARRGEETGDPGQVGGQEDRTGKALLKGAAEGNLNPEEAESALDFFLSSEEDEQPEIEPKTLGLNVGTTKKPRFVKWTVIPVDDEEITRIRRSSQTGTKAQKRRGEAEVNESLVARRIVVRGTIDPDLRELSREMVTGDDPADAVHRFFARVGKTGLITQISGEILSLSGWDDDDIKEIVAARG